MIGTKKICIVLPAYNAGQTLEQTYNEIPFDIIDDVILADDGSNDNTLDIARKLGIQHIIQNPVNKGYGSNQKICYRKALETDADIILMLHPDYQYTPKLIHSMCYLIANGVYEVVLGSRILGKGAVKGGMPVYKYIANRFLTFVQNLIMNQKLSEYHTGYRAFSRKVLEGIDFSKNSDDFIFDNQMLAQIFYAGFEIAEITCPCKYFKQASSINFRRSMKYGAGVLLVSLQYFFQKIHLCHFKIFRKSSTHKKTGLPEKIITISAGTAIALMFIISMIIRIREPETQNTTPDRNSVIRSAELYLKGHPKELSGRKLDCSGYTREVYRNFSYRLSSSSSGQYRQCEVVGKKDLAKGDLVFFNTSGKGVSHVGIYIEDGYFIHSPGSDKNVRIDSLTNSYYEKCFISGGSINFNSNKK
jgi:glycosyltransferase involved in cell wall biosynthesis